MFGKSSLAKVDVIHVIVDSVLSKYISIIDDEFAFQVHYQVFCSFGKKSGSTAIFRGYHVKKYTRRESGTFFHATLKLVASLFEMHCRRATIKKNVNKDRECEVLETLHRELCTCSCSTRKRGKRKN